MQTARSFQAKSRLGHAIARWPALREEFPLPAERGEGQGEGCLENTRSFSGNVFKAFPLTPALSLGERENRPPRLRESRAPQLVAARDAESPLPKGEGQGEGEPDAANQNGWTILARSIRPAPRLDNQCSPKTNLPTRFKNDQRSPPSALVFRVLLPPHPTLSLGERENLPPPFRQSRASRFVAARDAVFPLPAGEGQGEGERDGANQNDRTNLASSTRPSPRVKVGYHIGPKACRERKRAVARAANSRLLHGRDEFPPRPPLPPRARRRMRNRQSFKTVRRDGPPAIQSIPARGKGAASEF